MLIWHGAVWLAAAQTENERLLCYNVTLQPSATFPAIVCAYEVVCSAQIEWKNEKGSTSKRTFDVITKFPASHPKVTESAEGACGNIEAGSPIPTELSWRWKSNLENWKDDMSCKNMSGAEVFYAYNYPFTFSANPGRHVEDYSIVYMVLDQSGVS